MNKETPTTKAAATGMGYGSFVAFFASWAINHSIGWAIVHGCCGWFYILYWFFGFAGEALK